MLLLAVDTSGKHGSIALARCGPGEACNVIEVVALEGGTFSAQLVPQIAGLLAKHGFTKHDIGGFAVASGPGSFTGLRVGLAAIKGLAEILGKPVVAVSLLEALAQWSVFVVAGISEGRATPSTFDYAVAMNAGRQEVYVTRCNFVIAGGERSGTVTCAEESLISWTELAEMRTSNRVAWIATPDSEVLDFVRASFRAATPSGIYSVKRPGSADIAQLGWMKLQAGETVSVADLEANYIRRSDAEIFLKSGG